MRAYTGARTSCAIMRQPPPKLQLTAARKHGPPATPSRMEIFGSAFEPGVALGRGSRFAIAIGWPHQSGTSNTKTATRSGVTTVPPWGRSFALLCLLGSASSAPAQGPDDFLRTFGTITQPDIVQATQAAWAKLPPTEVGCMSAALRQQGGSVEGLIQRGVLPSDPRLANERSNCKRQSGRQEPQQIGSQRSAYAVSGVTLGATVQFGSSAYREYECSPSDQFDGFTWCQKTRKEKERRGTFSATYSILHSRDGATVYVNRYQEPAFFGAKEADSDIQQYSRKIGESPRITRMPHRAGFPTGVLASWGKVELEPLDDDSIKALAEGARPTTKGYFIDFIGDRSEERRE